MTCTALTTLAKLVALDTSKSNIFTHYIDLNTTIITQCSDKKYVMVINLANYEEQLLYFLFDTTASKKR